MLAVNAGKLVKRESRAQELRDDRCSRGARDSEAEEAHEENVEDSVRDRARHQVIERMSRIAHCLEDTAAGVVHNAAESAEEIDAEIHDGIGHNVRGSAHQAQKKGSGSDADHRERGAHDQAERDRGVDRDMYAFVLFCAETLAYDDAGSDEKTLDKAHEKEDKTSRRADRRQSLAAEHTPDNDRVDYVIELLQELPHEYRKSKEHYFPGNTALSHIVHLYIPLKNAFLDNAPFNCIANCGFYNSFKHFPTV